MSAPKRAGDAERSARSQRMTWQRRAVLDELAEDTTFRSAQQIHSAITSTGRDVGLATVYRNLQRLGAQENVDVVLSSDGETLYRLCEESTHHHHLVCEQCGATEEVMTPQLEEAIDSLARQHGYSLRRHKVELYGLCPTCAAHSREG